MHLIHAALRVIHAGHFLVCSRALPLGVASVHEALLVVQANAGAFCLYVKVTLMHYPETPST